MSEPTDPTDSPVPIYTDPDQPIEARVQDLISRMTLEEKVSQTLHGSPAIERLGVPEYNWWNECLHGVARAGRATVFPQAIAMAATFDPERLKQVGQAVSDEARAKHHQALRQGNRGWYFGLTFWSPNINIFRDPRWGRGQETYGECPHLTARLGVAYVQGLQGEDPRYLKLVANAKHYAVHSGPEPERHGFDAVVNDKDLWETYLPAFEALVCEARVASVMGAYNRTNGEPCCASPTLLEEILRDTWGFTGHVVSDCGAICDIWKHHKAVETAAEAAAAAVKAGRDLNCGGTYIHLVGAVEKGLLDEADIDRALRRLFTARFQLGMFDPEDRVPYAAIAPEVVGCPAHRELARRTARDAMVLLKNDGLLPLAKDLASVGIVGPNAMAVQPLLGNYHGHSPQLTTPLEGIVGSVSPGTQISYHPGCSLAGSGAIDEGGLRFVLGEADVIVAVVGLAPSLEGEEGEASEEAASEGGGDRVGLSLPGRQEELLKFLATLGKPVVCVMTGGSAIECRWALENLPAVLMAWYPGEAGGEALADLLFGDACPSGRMPVTVPYSLDDLPPFTDYAMAGRTYRYMTTEPLVPFGFGLSYTQFAYQNLELSPPTAEASAEMELTATATVANTGDRDAEEVVQLYVRDVEASTDTPIRQLRGTRRVHLPAGQARQVRFALTASDLALVDDTGQRVLEPGAFEITVAGSQGDARSLALGAAEGVTATLTITGQDVRLLPGAWHIERRKAEAAARLSSPKSRGGRLGPWGAVQ